jgi:PIN domain nuclease of toxin-antitoxin system
VTVLLDTCTFLWWVMDAADLTARARRAIGDSDCLLSVASCWEIAVKASRGRLTIPRPVDRFVQQQLEMNGFLLRAITPGVVAELPFHHADPFDRLIAAQARLDEISIVTPDPLFSKYGVKRIW